jgi:hypothetical protein
MSCPQYLLASSNIPLIYRWRSVDVFYELVCLRGCLLTRVVATVEVIVVVVVVVNVCPPSGWLNTGPPPLLVRLRLQLQIVRMSQVNATS